ncbi:MAG: DUF502 domain-containing protein [Myxococcota bacterium]
MNIKKTLRRTFITGLLIVLPVLVTIFLIQIVLGQIDKAITPMVLKLIPIIGLGRWAETAWVDYLAPLVSIALSLLFIYLLGLIGENVIGRQLLKWIDKLLMQVPVVRGIYSATRQFLDTFSREGRAFNRVVLVEYPRKGLWTMALMTADTKGEVQYRTEQQIVSVFVPTTPNPTSGWLLFVPEEDVIELEMSVDEAFKMIISGGVLTPEFTPDSAASAKLVAK